MRNRNSNHQKHINKYRRPAANSAAAQETNSATSPAANSAAAQETNSATSPATGPAAGKAPYRAALLALLLLCCAILSAQTAYTVYADEAYDPENDPAYEEGAIPNVNIPVDENYDPAEQAWPQAPELDGEAVMLMETSTQAVIYEKNSRKRMYPASTTKILTALVVLENCSLNETVTFTEECCDLEEGAVTIDSVPGERMSLKDVMYGLLLPSGNDCAMALAIHTAGSVEAFTDMMNAKAQEIGATSSHFSNPSGLFDKEHYTTASDLALIAEYAFRNSTFVDIISHPTYVVEPTNMYPDSRVLVNTHEMITPGNADYSSDVIGGKTGYLYESGRCLVTYAKRDGLTLLSVILDGSYYGIFSETQELLDYGWNNFNIVNISESERRFSFADEDARVSMDSSRQILSLNNVPFSELSSQVHYAYYLDGAGYAAVKEDAGLGLDDPRQLYAYIDYFYAGHFLGRGIVYIDPDIQIAKASFINVYFVNVFLVILVMVLVVLAILFIIRLARRNTGGPDSWKGTRKRTKRGRVRYYNRSDSVDLRTQYIQSGRKDRGSIYDLNDIGIPHGGRSNTGYMADMKKPDRQGSRYSRQYDFSKNAGRKR